LGLRESAKREPPLFLRKRRLTVAEVEELEKKRGRPSWLGPTVEESGGAYKMSVPALYWGTIRVLERLVSSRRHMSFAETAVRKGRWVP
jgi:hypothetical protein